MPPGGLCRPRPGLDSYPACHSHLLSEMWAVWNVCVSAKPARLIECLSRNAFITSSLLMNPRGLKCNRLRLAAVDTVLRIVCFFCLLFGFFFLLFLFFSSSPLLLVGLRLSRSPPSPLLLLGLILIFLLLLSAMSFLRGATGRYPSSASLAVRSTCSDAPTRASEMKVSGVSSERPRSPYLHLLPGCSHLSPLKNLAHLAVGLCCPSA